jgi:Putative GTPase activating protein for Arf
VLRAWISTLQQGIGAAFQQSLNADQSKSGDSKSPRSRPRSPRIPGREEQKKPKYLVFIAPYLKAANGYLLECGRSSSKFLEILRAVIVAVLTHSGQASTWELLSALVREFANRMYCCIEMPSSDCSGVHRSLGVHYSKVRSLTLDSWEPEIVKVMAELGNKIVNKVYEADVTPEFTRATPNCQG